MFKYLVISLALLLPNIVFAKQVDPTRPFGAQSVYQADTPSSKLALQSIIRSHNDKKAVINGVVLKVGDKYKGYELMSISSKGVMLKSSQGKMELSLFSGVIANSK